MSNDSGTTTPVVHCSFCGKHQDDVTLIIAGPQGVNICDECVGLCNEIIDDASTVDADCPS